MSNKRAPTNTPDFISDNEMADFIPDDQMAALDGGSMPDSISDEQMAALESSKPSVAPSASAVRGVAQGATLGFADEISGSVEALWHKAKGDPTEFGKLYSQFRNESRANFKKAKEANPGSYLAGEIVGGVATAAVPGLGAAGSLTRAVATGAALGAASGVGLSEEESARGMANDALGGVVAGGVLGAGGHGLAKGAGVVGGKMKEGAEWLAARALGAERGTIKSLGADKVRAAGRHALDNKILSKRGNTDLQIQRNEAVKIRGGDLMESVHNQIDDAGVSTFNPLEAATEVDSKLGNFYRSPINRGETNQLENTIESILMRGEGNVPIKVAQELKEELSKVANWKNSLNPTDKELMAREATRIVTRQIDDAVERGAKEIGSEGLLETLKQGRKLYSNSKTAEKLLENKQASTQGKGNKWMSLSDSMVAGGALSYGAVSEDYTTAMGIMAAKKLIGKYGVQNAAILIDKISKPVASKTTERIATKAPVLNFSDRLGLPAGVVPKAAESEMDEESGTPANYQDGARLGNPDAPELRRALIAGLKTVDSVSGAPFRKAVGEIAKGPDEQSLGKIIAQFGANPETAPQWREIVRMAGIEDEYIEKAADFAGPFLEPNVPGLGMIKKAGKGAKAVDTLADNAKLVERIGNAEKIAERTNDLGHTLEHFKTDKGFDRIVVKNKSGNIIASVIVDANGKPVTAAKVRGDYPLTDRSLNEALGNFLPHTRGHWEFNRKLSDVTKYRAELKEFPSEEAAKRPGKKGELDESEVIDTNIPGQDFREAARDIADGRRSAKYKEPNHEQSFDTWKKQQRANGDKRTDGELKHQRYQEMLEIAKQGLVKPDDYSVRSLGWQYQPEFEKLANNARARSRRELKKITAEMDVIKEKRHNEPLTEADLKRWKDLRSQMDEITKKSSRNSFRNTWGYRSDLSTAEIKEFKPKANAKEPEPGAPKAKGEVMPFSGRGSKEEWVADGFKNVLAHTQKKHGFEAAEQMERWSHFLGSSNVKARSLLMMASDLKPGSKAMDDILKRIEKLIEKVEKE